MEPPAMSTDPATPAPGAAGATADSASDGSGTVLTLTEVSKTYTAPGAPESIALEPVSTAVAQGEFLSLVGPSGCGKTTLLKLCAGLIPATGGTVSYRGTGAPVGPGTYGMVFQSPALLPWRTVRDNVRLPADILGLDRTAARERAADLIRLVRLEGAADKHPGELSGGMQQRAAIARALLHDPDLLMMDEPFGALDAMTREELNMELQRIHLDQRKTVLFVTHSITEAVLLSDRVLVLSAGPGRVVADIPIPLDRPRGPRAQSTPEFRAAEEQIRAHLDHRTPGEDAAAGTPRTTEAAP